MSTSNEPIYLAELNRIRKKFWMNRIGDEYFEEYFDDSDANSEYQPDVEKIVEDLIFNPIRNVEQEDHQSHTKKQKKI